MHTDLTTPPLQLPGDFDGQSIVAGDERYDSARALWNAAIDRRPAAILRPRSATAVASALLAARDAGLEIAIRGGGHSVPGHSMSDGGVTIDLGLLNGVRVDPAARRAHVGGGALLLDTAEATAPHSLTIPYGHVSHTGVAGLTLGGGIGWVMRRYGLAIDSLRSAQVVTAEGELVATSEAENPDLFWALRGGGGNFGIVTSFEFELHPHGPEVLAGMILHPIERAGEALRFSRDFMEDAPRELSVYETLITAPPEAPFPTELQGRPALAIALVCTGPIEEAERITSELRRAGDPALDLVAPMPAVAVQKMLDPTAPPGRHNYNRAHWLRALPDAGIDALITQAQQARSPFSQIINARMGGAITDVPETATAFAHRDANRLVWIVGTSAEPGDEEPREWAQRTSDALAPYARAGTYVNALGDEGEDRIRASYGDENYRRLRAVKRAWDPDNVFRLNQNIAPA